MSYTVKNNSYSNEKTNKHSKLVKTNTFRIDVTQILGTMLVLL